MDGTNTKKNEVSFKVLKQGLSEGLQEFDAMKEELKFAQNRNRNSNFFERYKANENMVAKKRETDRKTRVYYRRTTARSTTLKTLTLPDYCGYMEAGIRDYNIEAFVEAINKELRKLHKKKLPKLMQECLMTFDDLLTSCEIETKLHEKITRPTAVGDEARSNQTDEKTKVEEVGVIDIRQVNNTDMRVPPIVVNLRYIKTACFSMARLIKFLNVKSFDRLYYPNERIILLALTFSASGDPAISEWMALFYQNGRIVGAQQNATCLDDREFADLKYKDKHLKEYFTNIYK